MNFLRSLQDPRGPPEEPGPSRRRTESMNSAFARLRSCIPDVPPDTKLSKIKTLRLAAGYIAHLTELLEVVGSRSGRSLEPRGAK